MTGLRLDYYGIQCMIMPLIKVIRLAVIQGVTTLPP
jgi:hypothetical protein